MGNYTFILQNKKAAEKILSIYWFIILIITVVGIYGMVMLYYGHPYDIRQLEADLLTNKVANCISNKGLVEPEVFNKPSLELSKGFQEDFLDKCNITFSVEPHKDWKEVQYYIEINFYLYTDSQSNPQPLGSISKGEKTLKEYCESTQKRDYKRLPKCINKRFLTLYGTDLILVDIFSAVRKSEKNVK